MLLSSALPGLADELEQLLAGEQERRLAEQVDSLRIVALCDCGDGFCSSFYTQPRPVGAYGPGHRTVVLEPGSGLLIVDVVADQIVHVEVLYRDDIRLALEGLDLPRG